MALGSILALLALLIALVSLFIGDRDLVTWAVALLALAFLVGGGNLFKS